MPLTKSSFRDVGAAPKRRGKPHRRSAVPRLKQRELEDLSAMEGAFLEMQERSGMPDMDYAELINQYIEEQPSDPSDLGDLAMDAGLILFPYGRAAKGAAKGIKGLGKLLGIGGKSAPHAGLEALKGGAVLSSRHAADVRALRKVSPATRFEASASRANPRNYAPYSADIRREMVMGRTGLRGSAMAPRSTLTGFKASASKASGLDDLIRVSNKGAAKPFVEQSSKQQAATLRSFLRKPKGDLTEEQRWAISEALNSLRATIPSAAKAGGASRVAGPAARRAGRVARDAGITAGMLSPAIAESVGRPIPSFGNNVLNSRDKKAALKLRSDQAAGRGRTRRQR